MACPTRGGMGVVLASDLFLDFRFYIFKISSYFAKKLIKTSDQSFRNYRKNLKGLTGIVGKQYTVIDKSGHLLAHLEEKSEK